MQQRERNVSVRPKKLMMFSEIRETTLVPLLYNKNQEGLDQDVDNFRGSYRNIIIPDYLNFVISISYVSSPSGLMNTNWNFLSLKLARSRKEKLLVD